MRAVGKLVRWVGVGLGALLLVLLLAVGLLQMRVGKAWLATEIARVVSDPDFAVTVEGLGGSVPFGMTVARVAVSDRDGTYLTLRDVGLDIAPAALLAGRLHIRALTIAEIDMARLTTAPSTKRFVDYLRVPHLPVGVVLDRLAIDRLALAPPVLGESLVATVAGNAELAGGKENAALDLRRIDGTAGNVSLAMDIAGDQPALTLRLAATEPTGVLLDRLLGRTDRLPLALSVNGAGLITDWHGRLSASAGMAARVDMGLTLAAAAETAIGLSGAVAVAGLMPAELAPLVGDRVVLSLNAKLGDRTVVDPFSIETAAGAVTGDAAFGGADGAVAAHLRADVPQLSVVAGLLGEPVEGSAALTASVAGTASRPSVEIHLAGTGIRLAASGAERVAADIWATPTGALDDPDSRIDLAARGRIEGLAVTTAVVPSPELGRDLDWSLAAIAASDGRSIDLTRLSAEGAGVGLSGSGRLTEGGAIDGLLHLSVVDLHPFSGLAGHSLAGSLDLDVEAMREGDAGFKGTLTGSTKGLSTGIAAADALVGSSVRMTGSLRREADGSLALDQLAITGAAVNLSGDVRFDPAANQLAATFALDVPRLKPLGTALGAEATGALSARLALDGLVDRLRLSGDIDGTDITANGAKLDRVRITAHVPDLAAPQAVVDGSFRAYGLDGTLALAAEPQGNSELVVPHFRAAAADSSIAGGLRIALDTGLLRGSVAGRMPDLGRWSKLAGTPLAGSLEFSVGLDAHAGQAIDLSVNGARLAAGAGSSAIAANRLAVTARFSDVLRAPSGSGRVSLTSAAFGAAQFATATLSVDAPRPGRFVFQGDAKGQPLTLALAGDGGLEPGRFDLRLTRLTGSLGGDRILLDQPLTLSKHGNDLAFSGLAVEFGTGRITGNGGLRGEALSLALNAADLPIASGTRLLGYRRTRGTLSAAATLGGTVHAPQGRLSVNARELTVAATKHSRLTGLGLAIDGNWNGRNIDLNGQVTGLKEDRIAFGGSLPVLLTTAPLGVSVPPDGRLALQLRGTGQIEHLADLLPLGEDRVSGRFAADIAVGGTVASPAANGRFRISDGRYENFATGAVLTKLQADIVGDRDRFTLSSFSAADNASGSLEARGNVALKGPAGPTAQLSATLAKFRIAAHDEAVATASGTVSIAGPLASPKVTAPLTIDRADINLPESLPPNVVVLKVVETGGKTAERQPAAAAAEAPALPASLDITLDMPGNIFVRGHGLESEWRGRLKITGTSASPVISGALEQIRGSVDLLGKTFTLARGVITFDGSSKLDPVLDIVAETSAADITAQVLIRGPVSAPKVTLSSTPLVPQDEILARVLFNRGVGQITAAQGLQLAAAAGTLAGGGPGMLDRLRGGLGLDWFRLGSGPAGPASSTLNPRATNGATGGTALSAGKYLAPGVSVGVSQGLSPPTSKVTVEIEVRPHLTIQGEAGQSGSTGIGLNYNYDY